MSLRISLLCTVSLLICCGKPVPAKVESGFEMAKHSLSFANFAAGYDDATMNAESMHQMFGSSACKNQSSPCELTLGATAFMNKANKAMQGGRCEGFAVLSSLMQAGKVSVTDFGGENARDLTLNDNSLLQRELAYWFTTQLHPSVVEKTKGYQAKDVMPVLAEALAKDAKERFRIGIVKKTGDRVSGGHAVTPIAYHTEKEGVYLLSVYDNNIPDVIRTFRIDTKANRWEYEASENPTKKSSLYYGDSTNKNLLYLAPIFTRAGELSCHFCDSNKAQINTSGGVQVSVNGTGVEGGEATGGEGAVSPTFSSTNDEDGASWNIIVSSAGGLNVKLAPGDDGTSVDAEQASVDVSSAAFSAAVSGLNVQANDSWVVSADGREQTYTNESRTPLTLSGTVENGGKTVTVTANVDGASSEVSAGIAADGDIEVAAKGAVGTNVTVKIEVTDEMGSTKSGTLTYTSEGDSKLTTDATEVAMTGTVTGSVENNGVTQPLGNACLDGKVSGMESDIDCGGTCDSKCTVGQQCNASADCRSAYCNGTTKRCVATQCEDQLKTGDESDVDCGGASCAPCAVGKACGTSLDCAAGLTCDALVCKTSYLISVNVAGLPAAGSVQLTNATSGDVLTMSTNETRAFPTRAVGPYSVSITQQPANATCTLMNGVGTATAAVTLSVTCTPTFGIGGTVSGLEVGKTVTLANNGGDAQTVSSDGAFAFSVRVLGAYAVTVQTQPLNQLCTVTNASGTASADVANVTVACVSTFGIGGAVSGLDVGKSVTLLNNGGNALTVNANGPFSFTTRVTGTYAVTVQTQPAGQTCGVTNANGTATGDVSNVAVICVPAGFAIGGTVSGLPATRSVTLLLNGANSLPVSSNGPFTFPGFFTSYAVTIGTQPVGAVCNVTSGSGTATGTVSNVQVTCVNTSGTLDVTFNGTGVYSYTPNGFHNEYYRVVVNPDNTFVWVGRNQVGGADEDWVITKFTTAGVPDNTFGTSGSLGINRGNAIGERARVIHRNSDGTYLVAGSLVFPGLDFGVAKVTAAGALDMSFGTGGVVTHDLGGADTLLDMKVLSDGSMVLVGTTNTDLVVLKLTSAGAVDTGFGTAGRYTLATAADEAANAVDVKTTTGDIFVAGYTNASGNYNTLIVSLSSFGLPNMMFANNGVLDVDLSGNNTDDRAQDIDLENGNPTICGFAAPNGNNDYLLAQFDNFTGAPTSYGTSGKVLLDRANGNERALALRYLPLTGGFMIAGNTGANGSVVKFGNSGLLDTTFASSGQFQSQMGGPSATVNDLAFDSLDRILIGGSFTVPGGNNPDFGAARLLP